MAGKVREERPFKSPRIYTAFDRALIEAKAQDKDVEFSMSMPVQDEKEDEHTCVIGKIVSVDVFTVEVAWAEIEGTIWLNKAAMTGARIIP